MDPILKSPQLLRQLSAVAVLEYSILILLLAVTGEPLLQLLGARYNDIEC